MKSKLVILSLVLAGLATAATAQTASRYYAESSKDNFFVSAGIGGQLIVKPNASDNGFTPVFNVSLGKLINPVWGVRFGASVGSQKMFSNIVFDADYNGPVVNEDAATEYKKTVGVLRVDGMFNLSNAIAGYNPDRKFEAYAFMGPALQLAKADIGGDDGMKALISGSLGLGAMYNVNSRWALNLEVRGEVAESAFGDYSETIANGLIGASIGATYYFGFGEKSAVADKGGKNFTKVSDEALLVAANGDIKKYKELLAAEQTKVVETQQALAAEKAKAPQVVEKIVEVPVAGPRAIFFQIGSAVIDGKGKVNIGLAADIMKATPEVKYIINGYADKATGSVKTNQRISEKLAKAVYDALIKAGVSESQIEWKGLGGQPNMWENSRALTRVVVIEKAN